MAKTHITSEYAAYRSRPRPPKGNRSSTLPNIEAYLVRLTWKVLYLVMKVRRKKAYLVRVTWKVLYLAMKEETQKTTYLERVT